ncbi:hypothetical protein JCM13664_09060 [Methylothermus subterraneus]
MVAHPLSHSLPGQTIRIVAIPAKPVRMRLLSLGLAPKTTLTVLWNRAGTVVVGRDGDRLAIGCKIAKQILVEQVENP